VVKQLSIKQKVACIGISGFILLWGAFFVKYFELSNIYSNPFFRGLEFFMGILLVACKEEIDKREKWKRLCYHPMMVITEFLLLVLGVSLAVENNWYTNEYMLYNVISLPYFCLIIISMAGINLKQSVIIEYFCDISYAFFLAQFFTWKFMKILNLSSNLVRIVISFLICFVIAVLLHELIEKPLKKVLKRL